ncbi:MAG: Flp pilus assembly complex ATPase component TadA [Planctomycetes bacterium]|nr:Flp pilus assembly complex ATPase component TadA [Planctomycetota bacterium]
MHMLADIPQVGGYASAVKMFFVLLMMAPWLYVAPLVQQDAKRAHASPFTWSVVILSAGSLGLMLWLMIPVYIAGMAVYFVVVAASLASYVVYRNGRVDEDFRILTRRHISALLAKRSNAPKIAPKPMLKLYGSHGKMIQPPGPDATTDEIQAFNVAQKALYDLFWHRASEAAFVPNQQEMTIRYMIDGVVSTQEPLSLEDGQLLINYVKPVAGLDLTELRRPQKGDMSADVGSKRIDISVATAGTTSGQQMQVRILQEIVRQNIEQLGMTQDVLDGIREQNRRPGIIIVSGRSGSGVTSTLYSLMREHDAFMKHLVTLEAKIAVPLENITQNVYGEPSKLHETLAPVLRRDPDILMVDSVGDVESARLLLSAASTKTILIGMHAEDTFTALARWVKICGDAHTACEHLNCVVCQRMLRKLCTTCRESYKPDPQMLAKANLPNKIEQFYRVPVQQPVDEKGNPIICSTCHGTGYFERTAVFELLTMTDQLQSLIASGASLQEIKSAARKNKMLYMQEQALRKVMAGVTSIQEVLRTSQTSKASKAKQGN